MKDLKGEVTRSGVHHHQKKVLKSETQLFSEMPKTQLIAFNKNSVTIPISELLQCGRDYYKVCLLFVVTKCDKALLQSVAVITV